MTAPHPHQPGPQHPALEQAEDESGASTPTYLRRILWVAIGALVAAAIVCVVWVLIGPDNGIIARAFLTILLLAAFAGVAILDANLAHRRPAWFALASMVVWVVTLLIGAFLVWMPARFPFDSGVGRFFSFLLIVLILQLALLHVRLYTRAHLRYVTAFTRTITYVTVALVAILALMLVVPLTFNEWMDFGDLYWRFVVAVTILAAVGTALVPLINALFAPKRPRAAAPAQPGYAAAPQWPTYADGITPLPVMPDGSPDWNAYYTGYPSIPQGHSYPTPPYASAQPEAWPPPAHAAPQGGTPVAGGADAATAGTAPADAAPAPAQPEPTQTEQPSSGQPPVSPAPVDPPPPHGYQGYPPPPPPPPAQPR